MNVKVQASERVSEAEITLGILNAVHSNERVTQRSVAQELGIALGLTNIYLKRCVSKGFIKVREAPPRRYAYYLTPHGFSEKSRLTARYLTNLFQYFRNARTQCSEALAAAEEQGWNRVVLYGAGELADVASLCRRSNVEIVGVVDPDAQDAVVPDLTVSADFENLGQFDAVLVTTLSDPQAAYDALCKQFPSERILTPPLLRVNRSEKAQSAAKNSWEVRVDGAPKRG